MLDNENKIDFNMIKDWIQKHLRYENDLLSCSNEDRKVNVKYLKGIRTLEIPVKKPGYTSNWVAAWVQVYGACQEALEERVQYICLNDPNVSVQGNKIIVAGSAVVMPSNPKDINYINALENIINLYNKYKHQNIEVKERTIKIDKPKKTIKPKEIDFSEVRPGPKICKEKSNKNQIVGQKVSDKELLTNDDIEVFKKNKEPFVLITCSDLDEDAEIFMKNASLCEENDIPIGAFISGKADSKESASKELKKIMNLLVNYKILGPVIYEINNDVIKKSREDYERVLFVYDLANVIVKFLSIKKYVVLIAMDLDTLTIINNAKEKLDYNKKEAFPHILRILPRELDEIEDNESTILMDPVYDYDIVTIKD